MNPTVDPTVYTDHTSPVCNDPTSEVPFDPTTPPPVNKDPTTVVYGENLYDFDYW